MLGVTYKSSRICECGHTSAIEGETEPIVQVNIELEQSNAESHPSSTPTEPEPDRTIAEVMSDYRQEEVLEDYVCEECNEKGTTTQTENTTSTPPYLAIHLKRRLKSTKSHRVVHATEKSGVPLALAWPPRNPTQHYDLQAMIVHEGSESRGHYMTYTYNQTTDQWVRFSDLIVNDVVGKTVHSAQPCALYYKRMQETQKHTRPQHQTADCHAATIEQESDAEEARAAREAMAEAASEADAATNPQAALQQALALAIDQMAEEARETEAKAAREADAAVDPHGAHRPTQTRRWANLDWEAVAWYKSSSLITAGVVQTSEHSTQQKEDQRLANLAYYKKRTAEKRADARKRHAAKKRRTNTREHQINPQLLELKMNSELPECHASVAIVSYHHKHKTWVAVNDGEAKAAMVAEAAKVQR